MFRLSWIFLLLSSVLPALAASPDSTLIAPPVLLIPADGEGETVVRPAFLWKGVEGAAIYRLQLAPDSAFTTLTLDDSALVETTVVLRTPLANDSLFFWRVGVRDTLPFWSFSAARSFRVGPCPSLLASSVSFGEVRCGDSSWTSVVMRNAASSSLTLDSVWSASGRFSFGLPLPAQIDSLDSLYLLLGYSPREFLLTTDSLHFRTSFGTALLPVSGNSPPPLCALSRESLLFPPVALGEGVVRRLTLYNRGVINRLGMGSVLHRSRAFQVLAQLPISLGARDSLEIAVRFSPPEGPGEFGTYLDTLRIESDGGSPVVALRGASPPPLVVATPRALDFGEMPPGDSLQLSVVLENRSVNTLRIDSLLCWNPAFRVATEGRSLRASERLALSVEFDPLQYGEFSDTLRIYSNAEGSPLGLPLRGGVPPPVLSADQKLLQFGEIPNGETGRMVVAISNSSISPLSIDSLTTGTSAFRVEKFPLFTSLHRGDTLRVSVTFAPDSAASFHDTLSLYSDAVTREWRIPLFGRGKSMTALEELLPGSFALLQNFPNPFTGVTTFRYVLPEPCNVVLTVFSSLGQVTEVLVSGEQDEGYHNITWHTDAASGMYFYKLIAIPLAPSEVQYVATKRLMILR